MKVAAFIALAGLVQAGLASAIRSIEHEKFHRERRSPLAPVIETITTTLYQTVIWVDGEGRPVSTEINHIPPEATKPPNPIGNSSPDISVANASAQKPAWESSSSQTPAATIANPPSKDSELNADPAAPSAPETNDVKGNEDTSSSDAAISGMGVCYDMINGQTQCKDKTTINSEFSFLRSQGYGIVRVYDIGCPLGDFIGGASQNGLKIIIGINSITSVQGDLNKLIGMVNGNWGPVDTVYIGNEIVNGGHGTAASVASAVTAARGILQSAGYTGHVITVDTFNVMQNDPTICSTSDYCAANTHAFFDPNTAAEAAGQFVLNAYNAVAQANTGKRVVISESGWPWRGSCNGQACPSVENQKTAMNSIMRSFAGMPGSLFLFQAYNAGYKQPGSLGVEQYFGIYDTDHYNGGIGLA